MTTFDASALRANPTWLWGVTSDGLALVGRETELEVAMDLPYAARRRVVELLWQGSEAACIARATEATDSEVEALLAELAAQGALLAAPPPPPPSTGAPLWRAILDAERGQPVASVVWTADEAMILPPRLDPVIAWHVLRAFVAGLTPHARLAAYSYVARWLAESVRGDLPSEEDARAAADELGSSSAIVVLDFRTARRSEIDPRKVEQLGVSEVHRLGALQALFPTRPGIDGSFSAAGRYAVPNIAHPGPRTGRRTWGRGPTPEHAALVARAEAAERYAAGDVAPHRLTRACARELEGALEPERLFRMNERQRGGVRLEPYDAEVEYLWVAGRTARGDRRWLLADAVFQPFADVERPRPVMVASSSGVAAWSTRNEAGRRACCELIERDAFMWTWVQRVSRELIGNASLSPDLRRSLASVERTGWRVKFVNLTLETLPVVLCIMVGPATTLGPERLIPGLACHPDPLEAAAHAFAEAALIQTVKGGEPPERLEAEEVRSPDDHLALHQTADRVREDEFLVGSGDLVAIEEIGGGSDPVEALEHVCGEVVFVDLTSSASRPFEVVRALAPGLVPISFGYDLEPLGLARLAEAKRTADGRTLGGPLDLERTGPILPHPFP